MTILLQMVMSYLEGAKDSKCMTICPKNVLNYLHEIVISWCVLFGALIGAYYDDIESSQSLMTL